MRTSHLGDELHIDVVPVLLREGLRLFEHVGTETQILETLAEFESDIRKKLAYRIGPP